MNSWMWSSKHIAPYSMALFLAFYGSTSDLNDSVFFKPKGSGEAGWAVPPPIYLRDLE